MKSINKSTKLPKQLFYRSRDGLGYVQSPQPTFYEPQKQPRVDTSSRAYMVMEDPMKDVDSYYSIHRNYYHGGAMAHDSSRQLASSYIVDEDGSIMKVE